MSLVPFGFWAASGAGAIRYFLSTLGGANSDFGNSVAFDSLNNIYALGFTNSTGAGSNDFLISKSSPSGKILWQRSLGGNSGDDDGYSIAVNSSDEILVVGETNPGVAGGDDFLIAKYSNSGVLQWQRSIGGSGIDDGRGVALDSSDNVYAFGYTTSSPANSLDFLIVKYNSSGAVQWQRILGGAGFENIYSGTVDSSDNLYAVGRTTSVGAGSSDVLLAKYNSSGTLQWQRTLGGSGVDSGQSIKSDSSDNVYIACRTNSTGSGNYDALLLKYNSSGTLQWQRILGGADAEEGLGVVVDSLDNVYISGFTESTGAGVDDLLIAKYNGSGTIQWQRSLGGSGNERGSSISIDSLDDLCVVGYTYTAGEGGVDLFFAKIPSDGSLTGTYELDGVDFVYSASSLTASTSSLTDATSSLSGSSTSFTSSTSTLIDSSSSLTSHFVKIPE